MLLPSTIMVTAPRAAPLETPIRAGSARGLRNSPCRTAPETPSAAPTPMPSSRRGSRTASRMISSRRPYSMPTSTPVSVPERIPRTWPGLMTTAPMQTDVRQLSSSSSPKARICRRVLRIRRCSASRRPVCRSGTDAMSVICGSPGDRGAAPPPISLRPPASAGRNRAGAARHSRRSGGCRRPGSRQCRAG